MKNWDLVSTEPSVTTKFYQNYQCKFNMFLFVLSILFATAAGVTAFLLLVSGDMRRFKENFAEQPKPQLPVVTPDGRLVDNKEDLELELDVLEDKLNEKQTTIVVSKAKIFNTEDSIERLSAASLEVKKYYRKLKDEIARSEKECKELQEQIEDYKQRKQELKAQMHNNEKQFQDLVKNVKGDAVRSEEQPNSSAERIVNCPTIGRYAMSFLSE